MPGTVLASANFWHNEGTLEDRGGNAPFFLNDPDSLWLVETGSVDVFSVVRSNGNLVGPRRHLWTADQGNTLLGFDGGTAGQELLAVGTPGTQVRQISVQRLQELARDPQVVPHIAELAERFVTNRSVVKKYHTQPKLDVLAEKGHTYTAKKGERVGSAQDLVWVHHESGNSCFVGLDELTVDQTDAPLPLAKGLWFEVASDEAGLTVVDTLTVVSRGQVMSGLALLRSLFLAWAISNVQEEDKAEEKRLANKAAAGTRLQKKSLWGLASLVTRSVDDVALSDSEDDPLLAACQIIGGVSGIGFKSPPRWETSTLRRDGLGAICRASRVRSRRVTLDGKWWRRDCGQLLVFRGEEKRPAALLRVRGRYYLHDPFDGSRRLLNPEVIASLGSDAHMFYRPFPERPMSGKDLLRRLFSDLKGDLRFVALMALFSGLLGLLVPVATSQMVGQVIPSAQPNQALTLFLGLVGVHVGVALFDLARAFVLVRIEGKSDASLQAAVIDRLLALPVPFFRKYPVGELSARANSINVARTLLSGAVPTTVLAGIFSMLYFILLVYYNWRLALLGLAVLLVAVLVNIGFSLPVVRAERRRLKVQGDIGALVFQLIGGIAKLRVAAAEGRAFANWAQQFKGEREITLRMRKFQNVTKVFNDLLPLLSSLALFATAGYLLRAGHDIDTGTFIAFNTAYGSFFAAVVQVSNTAVTILNAEPIITRGEPILQAVPEVEAAKPDPGELSGRIEVEHLSFRYRDDAPLILQDVSFRASPGEFVAIVGPSGCGKSTTLRLLLGFERPENGVIFFDGHDLSSLDISSVRSQAGIVLQNSRLMSGSILDNIIGSSPLNIEDAWNAAEMAGVAEDIQRMPMGMHTVVAEGGVTFSGGQQQRLLIARALVRKPRILFFDEATSALDNTAQGQVSDSINGLNATRVVIAHRLSTIRHADRIYVLDRGKLRQSGSFEELAEQPGLFADLISRQML